MTFVDKNEFCPTEFNSARIKISFVDGYNLLTKINFLKR